MTVKELINALSLLPPDLPITREYDGSFEAIQVEKVQLYYRPDNKFNPFSEDEYPQGVELKDVAVIHSKGYPLYVQLYPHKEKDPNEPPTPVAAIQKIPYHQSNASTRTWLGFSRK